MGCQCEGNPHSTVVVPSKSARYKTMQHNILDTILFKMLAQSIPRLDDGTVPESF